MQLVFIHGWGFDARFWDAVCALIPSFPQRRVDCGFFGNPSAADTFGDESILVGHSLGFVHGFMRKKDWRGWVAINSFARFVPGCATAAQLREMKVGLTADAARTLRVFYHRLDAEGPQDLPDSARLRSGLDELQSGDVTAALATLEAPGMVLAARHDPLVPGEVSAELGRMVHRGGIRWHETGGHVLPLSDPAWCAAAIKDFAESF